MDSCYATRSPQVLPHQGTVIRNAVHRDLFTISLATCKTSDDFGTRLDRYLLDYSTPNSKQLWVHQLRLLIRSIRLIQANPPNQRCSTMLDKCNQPNPPIMAYDAPEHLSFLALKQSSWPSDIMLRWCPHCVGVKPLLKDQHCVQNGLAGPVGLFTFIT